MERKFKRRPLLGALACGWMALLLPAQAAVEEHQLNEVATALAGLPVHTLPEVVKAEVTIVTQQLRLLGAPISAEGLRQLSERWPEATSVYQKVLRSLYARGSSLPWEAVPFASPPGSAPGSPQIWSRPGPQGP